MMTNIYDLMPAVSELIPYGYDRIKTPLYDHIIHRYLDQFKPQEHPVFAQVSGIPGAGKSMFCRQMTKNLFLSFDNIMSQIPDYQQDLYMVGKVQAFKNWEIPARIIGYEILYRSVMSRFDITLEHSGVNRAHIQLIKSLKKLGYDTNVYFISCPLSLALARAEMREKSTNRYTPPEMIKQRFYLSHKYFEKYKKLADHAYLYDTSSNKFVLKSTFNL